MKAKTLKITADTLAKAKEKINSKIPDGYLGDTVTIINDGEPRTARVTDSTIDAAFARARKGIPAQAIILKEALINEPRAESFQIEAFDERSGTSEAQSQIWTRFSHSYLFKGIKQIKSGRNGILGIGKKPNTYEVTVFQPALVEITWRAKAEIVVSLITLEGHIKKLIEELGNSKFTWELFAEPDDSYAVQVTNEGKSIRENAYRSLVSLGSVTIHHLCKALDDPRKPKTPVDYPSTVYPKSASDFSQKGPETKDEEVVGRTVAKLIVEIGERELVKQELAHLNGVARTRAIWALSRLGDSDADRMLQDLSQTNDPEARYYLHSRRKK